MLLPNYTCDFFTTDEMNLSRDSNYLQKPKTKECLKFEPVENIPKAFLNRTFSSKKLDCKETQEELVELLTKIESDTQENSNSLNNFIPLKSFDLDSNSNRHSNSFKNRIKSESLDLKSSSAHMRESFKMNPSKRSRTLDPYASEESNLSFFEEKPMRTLNQMHNSFYGLYNEQNNSFNDFKTSRFGSMPANNLFPFHQPPPPIPFQFSQHSSFNQANINYNNHHDFSSKEFVDPGFDSYTQNSINNMSIDEDIPFTKVIPPPAEIPVPFVPPVGEYDPISAKPILPIPIKSEHEICSIEMAKDQNGSRLIQQTIETASYQQITNMIKSLSFDVHSLVMLGGDVFGNYVIQKLLDHGSEEHRRTIVRKINGNILNLSLQMYGCRVVQKAIECGSQHIQLAIIRELSGHVLECIKDQNGNHVIQKCIEKIDNNMLDFIVDEISKNVIDLSTHPYGCRVIQRILENFDNRQKEQITRELFGEIPGLILDQYGNYVVQHILDHCSHTSSRAFIFKYIRDHVFILSSHKFASNVVEKCLISGDMMERREIAMEIINNSVGQDDDVVYKMMKDAYANYVIQKMIDVIIENNEIELFQNLVKKIKPHYPNLRKISYGKHIINKIDKITKNYSKSLSLSTDGLDEFAHFLPRTAYPSNGILMKANDSFGMDLKHFTKTNQVLCDSLTEFPSLICDSSMSVNNH